MSTYVFTLAVLITVHYARFVCAAAAGPCIAGRCPEGLVCDTATDTCVAPPISTQVPLITTQIPIITTAATILPIITTAATLAPACVDKTGQNGISDCAPNANLCNDTVYMNLMTEQCPVTCNRCGVTKPTLPPSGNFGNGTCVDLALPGKLSDCPKYAGLCTIPGYLEFMSRNCPRTCGVCPSTGKK